MQKKENLIKNLKNNTYCRLGVSPIHGFGVFAMRNIPKATEVFELCNDTESEELIDLTEEELNSLDENVVRYIKDIFCKDKDGYSIPDRGLNSLNISYFLNHSTTPNLIHKMNFINGLGLLIPVTNREIKKGEELTEDYYTMGELKDVVEQFPFLKAGVV